MELIEILYWYHLGSFPLSIPPLHGKGTRLPFFPSHGTYYAATTMLLCPDLFPDGVGLLGQDFRMVVPQQPGRIIEATFGRLIGPKPLIERFYAFFRDITNIDKPENSLIVVDEGEGHAWLQLTGVILQNIAMMAEADDLCIAEHVQLSCIRAQYTVMPPSTVLTFSTEPATVD